MQEKELHSLSINTISDWKLNYKKVTVFYGMWNIQNKNPNWEYAAEIVFTKENIVYVSMGHGIGRNKKVFASFESIVNVIQDDNNRFNQGKQMYFRPGLIPIE